MNQPITLKTVAVVLLAACALAMVTRPLAAQASPGYTPVRDVDNAVVNPFARDIGWFEDNTYSPGTYTVPAGKRLEITGVSGYTYAPGCTMVYVTIQVTMNGTQVTHRLNLMTKDLTFGATSGYFVMPYQQVNLYADPNSTVRVVVRRDVQPPTNTSWYCDVILTGRLVNQ